MMIRKNYLPGLLTALLIAILAVMASLDPQPRIIAFLENKSLDLRMELRGPRKPSGHVAIALVDEKSIQALGRWPWSRDILAALVDELSHAGTTVLGFDILFAEPQVTPSTRIVDDLVNEYMQSGLLTDTPAGQAFFDRLMSARALADPDSTLALSLEHFGRVVLGMAFVDTVSAERSASLTDIVLASAYGADSQSGDDSVHPRVYPSAILPIPILGQSSQYLGFVNTVIDDDGFIRKERMVISYMGLLFGPLSLKMWQSYQGAPQEEVTVARDNEIVCGDRRIPVTGDGFAYLNFYGPSGTIASYSVIDILEGKIPRDSLQGRIVLVGGAAAGIEDLWATVFDPTFRGVEKQATVIENVVNNDFLVHPWWNTLFVHISMIVSAFLLVGAIYFFRAIFHFMFCLSLIGITFFIGYYFFLADNYIIQYTYTFFAIIGTYLLMTTYRFLNEEKSRKFLHATFSSYVSEDVINDLYTNNKKPELGGEQRLITAFFTDIRSFSTFSEILSPRQLVDLLNEYYSAMTDILISEKGCLDKYEGDAIVAFFGAPHHLPDHACKAVSTAVRMQKKMEFLRNKWKDEYDAVYSERNTKNVCSETWGTDCKWPYCVHEMKMRIGINSGEIVVGNVGSSTRMNYTMMGDAVNLAARLESLGKKYGVCTLASEYTMHEPAGEVDGRPLQVKDMFYVRLLDRVIVVGRTTPVAIYEVIDFADTKNEEIDKT